MMGSQGAPASVIDEMKSLLGVVGDPAKLKAALDNLQSQQKSLNALIDSNSKLVLEVDKKNKALDQKMTELFVKGEALSAREDSLAAKESAYDLKLKDLKAQESKLVSEKQGFDEFKVKMQDSLMKSKSECDARLAEVSKQEQICSQLQDELSTKLSKLKAAMV